MRYSKILFILFLSEAILFSCSKNVLDLRPLGQLDATAVTNQQGVTALLIGAYSLLDGVGSPNVDPVNPWGAAGSNWLFGSVTGSEAHKGSESADQPEQQSIERFSTTAGSSYLLSKWGALYDGVQRCNDVLRIMRKVPGLTKPDTVEFRAEALFLRAHYHFEVKKMWNNIPFMDESITYEAGNYKMSNDVDIWPFIEEDLKYAVANLPKNQDQIGRANHYSAEALLAKVYLFQHKYDSAKILLDSIIASGKYSLKKYAENFNAVSKNNKESVFAAQSSVNDGGQGNNANIGDVLNQPHDGNSKCCGFFQPSQYFVNHFKTDSLTGLPDLDHFNEMDVKNDIGLSSSDPFTPYDGTLDPRLDWTVGRRGIPYLDWGLHPGKDWIRAQDFSGGPYSPKKTSIYVSQIGTYTDASFWTIGANAININLIRYADVLLWAAEAEVMSTNGSLAKAQDYVNQLRNRAADSSGWVYKYKDDQNPSAGFSDTKAANYFIKPYPGVWTDPVYAMKAIRYERMLELGMEGHRFFDLVRWGIAEHDISLYLDKEKNITGYLNGAVFNPSQDSYFPIPQSEIDKSDHRLKQNPGY